MLKYLFCLLFLIGCYSADAQSDTTLLNKGDTATVMTTGGEETDESDDEFNIFLFVIATGFFGAALGAVMAGAFAVFLFLSIAALLAIAGIVSASLLIGLYKRSLQSGFKSLLLISASLLGIACGLFILYLINLFLHLHLTGYQILLAGAGGGLIGGFLSGFIILRMIKTILKIMLNKLKFIN